MRGLIVLVLVALVSGARQDELDLINYINSAKLTWKAGHNPIIAKGKAYARHLMGARDDPELSTRPRYTPEVINVDIPESFDARQKWPQCVSIASIKDQGNCGSCWAVSSAAAMSDRLCIATDNKVNISAEYLMTCCSACGEGCDGGWPNQAWNYFQFNGIVTGGDYNSYEGCQPYFVGPYWPGNTPGCVNNKCTNKRYPGVFQNDHHWGSKSYYLAQDVKAIQVDLMNRGPVVATFTVYSDFMVYSSGVYQVASDDYLGNHAVRVIGWGVENGVDYWLVANSWGRSWGDNGIFKIRRGTNECGFEAQMTAGWAAI